MSQSPLDERESTAYFGGWSAIAGLIRAGRSWSGGEANRAFLNLGAGTFADASAPLGLDLSHDGRSVARVDWDQDGDFDLLVTGRDGRRFRYLRNTLYEPEEPAPAIAVRLVGNAPGTNAIGARIEWAPSEHQGAPHQTVQRAGEGFLSQSSSWHNLGCSEAPQAKVWVHWPGDPSGVPEEFGELDAGSRYLLVQGSSRARRAFPPSAESPVENPSAGNQTPPNNVASVAGERMLMAAPVPLPSLAMETADGRQAQLFGVGPRGSRGTGRPLLVHLWASWCAPCIVELAELREIQPELRESGVDSLALSLDTEEERPAALATLARMEWSGSRGFAGEGTAEVLDALIATIQDRTTRMALPTTLLLSPSGQLLALYSGPAKGEQLLADLELLGLAPEERRRRALPFDGLLLDPPLEANLALFEGKLRRRGLEKAAAEFSMAQVQVQRVDEAQAAYEFGVARAKQGRNIEARDLFRKAVEADPSQTAFWSALGWAAEVTGEGEEALAAYRRAVELDPKDATTRFNLGRLLLARGEVAGARSEVGRLKTLDAELAARLEAEIARSQ